MFLPRVTLRRNGTTSSGPSGPPNEYSMRASYGRAGLGLGTPSSSHRPAAHRPARGLPDSDVVGTRRQIRRDPSDGPAGVETRRGGSGGAPPRRVPGWAGSALDRTAEAGAAQEHALEH